MSDYTPSTDVVREGHAFFVQAKIAGGTFGQGLAEFDRWLAEHDRQVAERAWDLGHAKGLAGANDLSRNVQRPRLNPYRAKGEQK